MLPLLTRPPGYLTFDLNGKDMVVCGTVNLQLPITGQLTSWAGRLKKKAGQKSFRKGFYDKMEAMAFIIHRRHGDLLPSLSDG